MIQMNIRRYKVVFLIYEMFEWAIGFGFPTAYVAVMPMLPARIAPPGWRVESSLELQ
jgi:hypothetical protein